MSRFSAALGWAAAAFTVWWIIMGPDGAAHLVHNIGQAVDRGVAGLAWFLGQI